jgi:hypothetical protein
MAIRLQETFPRTRPIGSYCTVDNHFNPPLSLNLLIMNGMTYQPTNPTLESHPQFTSYSGRHHGQLGAGTTTYVFLVRNGWSRISISNECKAESLDMGYTGKWSFWIRCLVLDDAFGMDPGGYLVLERVKKVIYMCDVMYVLHTAPRIMV